jgi:cobaltochelatase CobT
MEGRRVFHQMTSGARISPALIGMAHRIGILNGILQGNYGIFTTLFDEVIDGRNLPKLLPKLSAEEQNNFNEAVRRFENGFSAERLTIAAAAAAVVRDVQAEIPQAERAETVISFLIDHSGSMRGLRMLSALIAVENAVDALSNLGIETEILGFTTRSWHGGRSRHAWRWAGKPPRPGRLCDLRHIVYGSTGRSGRFPYAVRYALRHDLLRENVDGEALDWAASRLYGKQWQRRIICVLSDGAPVDDATLIANRDQYILTCHLAETELRLRAEGFTIGFLLIGVEHFRYPDLHELAAEPQDAGLALLKLVRRALIPDRVEIQP